MYMLNTLIRCMDAFQPILLQTTMKHFYCEKMIQHLLGLIFFTPFCNVSKLCYKGFIEALIPVYSLQSYLGKAWTETSSLGLHWRKIYVMSQITSYAQDSKE